MEPERSEPDDSLRTATLPPWCDVYRGLSEKEIVDLEQVILTRADLTREFS